MSHIWILNSPFVQGPLILNIYLLPIFSEQICLVSPLQAVFYVSARYNKSRYFSVQLKTFMLKLSLEPYIKGNGELYS